MAIATPTLAPLSLSLSLIVPIAPRIASRVPVLRGGEPEADLAGLSWDALAVPAAPVVAVDAGAAATGAPPAAVGGGPGGG